MGGMVLLLLAGAAGLVAGLARRGDVRGLAAAAPRAWPFGVAALAVQALLATLPPAGAFGPILFVVALLTLLAVARANGQQAGMPLLALGLLLNLAVVVANLGLPVAAATLDRAGVAVERPLPQRPDAEHVLAGRATRLAALDDRFAVRPLRTVASVGTVAELAGLFLLVQHLLLAGRRPDGTAEAVHEARTVPWTTSADSAD